MSVLDLVSGLYPAYAAIFWPQFKSSSFVALMENPLVLFVFFLDVI